MASLGRLVRADGYAVWRLIEKRARIAGVTDVSPYDLRRSFVSDLLDAGVDVTTVSKMARQRAHHGEA